MSINSIGAHSFSSGSYSDLSESLTSVSEGYDYIFVPPLRPGYECPICLSVLREPRQTQCGHRFCRDCIIHWLKTNINRCPVDNENLTVSDIFPDNCIKREILNHDIKCPNHVEGCQQLTTILGVQKHLDQCQLSLVPCPLNCASVVRRQDVGNHLEVECHNRVLPCPNCGEKLKAGNMHDHVSECPKGVIQCDHCQADVLREEMNYHVEVMCKMVHVPCPFYALGCKEAMLREDEEKHLSSKTSSHLKMLSSSFFTLLDNFSSLAVSFSQLNGRINPSHSEAVSNQCISLMNASNTEKCVSSVPNTLRRQRSEKSNAFNSRPSCDEKQGLVLGLDKRSLSNNGDLLFSNELHENVAMENSYYSLPQFFGASQSKDDTVSNNMDITDLPLGDSSKSVPVQSQARTYMRSMSETSTPDQTSSVREVSDQSIPEFAFGLQKLCAYQAHMLEKQQTVINKLCTQMVAAESQLRLLDEQRITGSMQHTCGDFYWTINDFSVYRNKALKDEETSILHSPPFFSSPWGYKLCLRVNVKSMPNSIGEHYLSLFIHFMQGSNDHLLNWPFNGQIVLSIVDQNPITKERRHALETLKARPDVAAFQKPVSGRNHKGFGYTDFISLNILEHGSFIADDAIIVRAQVNPSLE